MTRRSDRMTSWNSYTEFHDVMRSDRRVIPSWAWMSAEYVVRESLQGLDRGKLFVVPNWKYRWLVRVASRLPSAWRMALERRSPHKRRLSDENAPASE
jgi:hypothetical protein